MEEDRTRVCVSSPRYGCERKSRAVREHDVDNTLAAGFPAERRKSMVRP